MFSSDRNAYRKVFVKAWRKAATSQPLEPLETRVVEILRQHPEYQPLLEGADMALEQDFSPEQGQSNPFLHMGLHLAILEQLSIDQPAGIRRLYQRLVQATGNAHEAEHRIMECLFEALWRLQRDQGPFDLRGYLECVELIGPDSHP